MAYKRLTNNYTRSRAQINEDIRTHTKYCPGCDTRLSMDLFNTNNNRKDKHQRLCIKCGSRVTAKWRKDNPEAATERSRKATLKYSYGLTVDEYTAMLLSQGGVCKVCGRTDSQHLSVDHCHSTGKIRGLLCHRCNLLLGKALDDTTILLKAINYLKENEA